MNTLSKQCEAGNVNKIKVFDCWANDSHGSNPVTNEHKFT